MLICKFLSEVVDLELLCSLVSCFGKKNNSLSNSFLGKGNDCAKIGKRIDQIPIAIVSRTINVLNEN